MNIGDNFLCTQECQALIEVEFDPFDSLNLQNFITDFSPNMHIVQIRKS